VSIRATKAEVTVIGRGQFAAKLTCIDLHRLWMQRFSDNLPQLGHSASMTGRAIVSFRTQPGPSFVWNSAEMHPTDIMRHREGGSSYQRSSGAASWGAMSLPMEDMRCAGAAIGGRDLTPPGDPVIVTPPSSAMAKLQRVHAAVAQLAEDASEIITHPEAARGLEQALIEALVACLGLGGVREDRSALRRHAAIIRRFRQVTEDNPERALYVPELCAAIGVSERSLRACCQEQLRMSPKRYLLLRRMNFARRALRDSAPTVTEIATRYGFWQLGRFAGEYKSLFGEAPSITLHRPWE
jgi:AraC-like DNA-binding protein